MGKTLKYKDINLLAAQDRKLKTVKEKKATTIRLPILILILVLLLLGLGYRDLYKTTGDLEQKKKSIELYLNDPATQAEYDESFRMQSKAQLMVEQKEEVEQVLLNLSSYPDIYGSDFHLIYEYAGDRVAVTGVTYSRQTGILAFNAECDTVTGVPIFVTQLRMSAIFDDIKYEGYTEKVVTTTYQGETTKEWVPLLGPDELPQFDINGNEMGSWQENSTTYSKTKKTYVFAITALVRAPGGGVPGPGEGVRPGGPDYGGGSEDYNTSGLNSGGSGSATK